MGDQNQDWFSQNAPGQQPAAQPSADAQQPAPTQAPITQPAQNTQTPPQNQNWFEANAPAPAPAEQASKPAPPQATIGPRNTNVLSSEGFNNWLEDVKGDVRSGTDSTWVGSVLRKLGAKGTDVGYGHVVGDDYSTNAAGDFMAGPALGVPTALQALPESVEAHKELAKGNVKEAIKHTERSLNRAISGTFQSLGPVGMIVAPEGEALAVVAPAIIAQHAAEKTAAHFGADEDTQELVGNLAALGTGSAVHSKVNLETLSSATEKHIETSQDYYDASAKLEQAKIDAQSNTPSADAALEKAQRNFNDAESRFQKSSAVLDDEYRKAVGKMDRSSFIKAGIRTTVNTARRVVGVTNDISEATTRAANMLGKKDGPAFKSLVDDVKGDLTAILNDNESIKDPNTAADAIDNHLQQNIEAPLQREAGATRDDAAPVVNEFRRRAEERIDKFFDDNRGKYGSPEEVEAIKDRLLSRLSMEQDLGNGTSVTRDPNLYEAENIRQGLSKASGSVFEQGTSDGYRAASADMANFMREVIDEGYDNRGVSNVKEARAKEAKLIAISEALRDAQSKFESQERSGTLERMFKASVVAGTIGTLLAHFTTGPLGVVAGLGELLIKIRHGNARDIGGNLDRLMDLAAQNPEAKAVTPGSVPPTPQGPTPPAEAYPNVPPPPTPPTPARPPAVNHALNGVLSSYFGEFLNAVPYEDLMQKFVNQVADMKQDIAQAKADPNYKPKYTQDQIDRAMKVQDRVNTEHAKEHAQVEKQNQAAQAKYQKAIEKYNEDARVKVEQAKIQEEERKKQEQVAAAKVKQDEVDRTTALLTDERVAHGHAMKATDPAMEIPANVDGRTSQQAHGHEVGGHIVAAVAEGLNPFAYISHLHDDLLGTNGLAQVHTDSSMAEKGPKGLAQRAVTHLGGPAYDEVHNGIKLENNTGASADIREARRILREEGGLSGTALDKVFDALYERAKKHVSNPDAAQIAKINAGLREVGLPENLHMSPSRISQLVEKLKGAFNNGSTETSTNGGVREGGPNQGTSEGQPTDTGGSGEEQNGSATGVRSQAAPKSNESTEPERSGLNKDEETPKTHEVYDTKTGDVLSQHTSARRAHNRVDKLDTEYGGIRYAARPIPEKSNLVNPGIPPERSTGNPEIDAAIKKGGGIPGGTMEGFPYKEGEETRQYPDTHLFHDPESGTTLALKKGEVTPEAVAEKLANSRRQYAAAKEKSSLVKDKSISDRLVDKYGTSDDRAGTGFILNDGRRVDFGATDHQDAVRGVTPKEEQSPNHQQDMIDFMNKEGAVRIRTRGFGGRDLAITVPEKGITPTQLTKIKQAVGAVGRESKLWLERTNADENGGFTSKEFPRVSDVDQMLRDIGAHPEPVEKSSLTKDEETQNELRGIANDINKSHNRPNINTAPVTEDARTSQIADAYKNAVHAPNDPAVKASYDALKRDLDEQYDALKARGFKMGTADENPYGLSTEMPAHEELHNDVLRNKNVTVWKGGAPPADHPMSEVDPKTGLTYNDKFRMVHDIFGHAAEKNDFSPNGEESAWNLHRQLFSPEARPALATETRGQAAYTYKNGDFPPQKAAILPEHLQERPEDLIQRQVAAHEANGGSTFTPEGKNLVGENTYAVTPYPERTQIVNQVTPENLAAYKEKNDDILADGQHAVGTWKDPDTGKTYLDVTKTIQDRDAAIKAGTDANQKAIYNLKTGETVDTGGTGEAVPVEKSALTKWTPPAGIEKGIPKDEAIDTEIPLSQLHVSDRSFSGASSNMARGRASKTEGPISVVYNPENGQYNVEDGMHRLVQAYRNGKETIPAKLWSGYSDVASVLPKNRMDLSPDTDVEKSDLTKGSSVPLMENPLKVKGTGENEKISTLDVAKALNKYSTKQHPALELDEAEPEEMVARAKKIAEDEAKYQLAQGKTGTEWYTTEMKEHDDALKSVRPEFEGGETIDAPTAWPHNPKLSLFKAAEAILSSGQKPYGNFKSAVRAWDIYNETGQFPRKPEGMKSWGPRGVAAYGNAMDMLNTLVGEKGEKGAAEWLLTDHPVSELRQYNKQGVSGKKDDLVPGAMILGEKRGPFMRNLHGIESAFTADMWVTRSWNRWMGTMETGTNSFTGEPEIQPNAPRNKTERDLMHKSFSETADKLGLSTSSLQAVLWYYEQALYGAQGIPKESWSFGDAAKRAVSEMPKGEEAESFPHGENEAKPVPPPVNPAKAARRETKMAGAVHALDFVNALKGKK